MWYPISEVPGFSTPARWLQGWLRDPGPLGIGDICQLPISPWALTYSSDEETSELLWTLPPLTFEALGVPPSTALLPCLQSLHLRLLWSSLCKHTECQSCPGSVLSSLHTLCLDCLTCFQLPSKCEHPLKLNLLSKLSFELQVICKRLVSLSP